MSWLRFSGKKIENIKQIIIDDILKYKDDYELKFICACDSQVHKPIVTFTTTIIMLRIGHGGLAYYENEKIPYNNIQPRKRLLEETHRAVSTALWLDELLLDFGYETAEIHADLNPSKKFLSNEVVAECQGYIRGMGFTGIIKPDAYGATTVANKKSK